MAVLSNHSSGVERGEFICGGKAIITGGMDSQMIIWAPKTQEAIHTERFGESSGGVT